MNLPIPGAPPRSSLASQMLAACALVATLTSVWTAASIAADAAFTGALAGLLRKAELALVRQESPESA